MISPTPISGNDPKFLAALTEAKLPTDDVGEPDRSFFRFEQDGRLLGYGGFELYREDAPSAILRTRQASSICSSALMLFRAI